MARYTNNDIKLTLSALRSKIRNGVVTVSFRLDPNALRNAVAHAFGNNVEADKFFSVANFNPQTVSRFTKLFEIPTGDFPTQDDTATALQNFLNRRSDPWAHVRAPAVEPALAAWQNV